MTASNHPDGARSSRRAASNPAIHIASNGNANRCGRANRLGIAQTSAPAVNAIVSRHPHCALIVRATIPNAAAAAPAVSSTTPLNPPSRYALASNTSLSHSWASQGCPPKLELNGSHFSTAR